MQVVVVRKRARDHRTPPSGRRRIHQVRWVVRGQRLGVTATDPHWAVSMDLNDQCSVRELTSERSEPDLPRNTIFPRGTSQECGSKSGRENFGKAGASRALVQI